MRYQNIQKLINETQLPKALVTIIFLYTDSYRSDFSSIFINHSKNLIYFDIGINPNSNPNPNSIPNSNPNPNPNSNHNSNLNLKKLFNPTFFNKDPNYVRMIISYLHKNRFGIFFRYV